MNYLKVYCNLIRKVHQRQVVEGYTEKHHIFPVSIFGKNNKVVLLTGREHYIAHALIENNIRPPEMGGWNKGKTGFMKHNEESKRKISESLKQTWAKRKLAKKLES